MNIYKDRYDYYIPLLCSLYKSLISKFFNYEMKENKSFKEFFEKDWIGKENQKGGSKIQYYIIDTVTMIKKIYDYFNLEDNKKPIFDDIKEFKSNFINLRNEVWHNEIGKNKPDDYIYYCKLLKCYLEKFQSISSTIQFTNEENTSLEEIEDFLKYS